MIKMIDCFKPSDALKRLKSVRELAAVIKGKLAGKRESGIAAHAVTYATAALTRAEGIAVKHEGLRKEITVGTGEAALRKGAELSAEALAIENELQKLERRTIWHINQIITDLETIEKLVIAHGDSASTQIIGKIRSMMHDGKTKEDLIKIDASVGTLKTLLNEELKGDRLSHKDHTLASKQLAELKGAVKPEIEKFKRQEVYFEASLCRAIDALRKGDQEGAIKNIEEAIRIKRKGQLEECGNLIRILAAIDALGSKEYKLLLDLLKGK